ncbi:MAG: PKD domain-containing protein [Lewinellaceae bacterium]|nr:PKD domain-containing protein [Lewinellaceae bacterium]
MAVPLIRRQLRRDPLNPRKSAWSINGLTTTTSNGNLFTFCPTQFNLPPGTVTLLARVYGINGAIAVDTLSVFILPFEPITIKSSNLAPCNSESDSSFCEKVCPGATVTYSIMSNTPAGQGFYSWNVTGASSWTINSPTGNPDDNGTSITVTWGATGAGSVSVFSDGFGCGGEASLCVTIIAAPQAAFTSNPPAPAAGNLTVCKDQTVYFQNQSSGADSYEWGFSDDLSTSTETSPQHTFLTPGVYTVSLIAFSNCLCSDTTQMTIEVLDAASPSLDCVGSVCPGEAVTYTASNGCQPFNWAVSANGTILGGGTADSDTISVLWNTGPTGTITLGSQPCSGMVCPIPAILEVPIISDDAEIEGRERVCPVSTEVYSIEPFGGTSFNWTLSGDGTIVDGQGTNRVTVQWTGPVNTSVSHWLSVTYENCYLGCGGQDSIEVHILSAFAINGPVEACVNGSVALVSKLISNGQNLNANWTLFDPSGASVWTAANTASVMPEFLNGAGKYRVLAVPFDPAQTCSDEQEWGVQVAPLPNVPGGITGERNICPGSTYTYEALGVAPNKNVRWTLTNGSGAAQMLFGNPVNVTWAAAGPYQLAAATVSTNGLNCSSDTIRIDPVLIGIPAITGTVAACEDALGSYSIVPQGIDIQWTISPAGAGAVAEGQGSNAAEIFWTQPGNHTVNVAVCGQSATFPVTVWANPEPVVQHPAGLCPGATGLVQTSVAFSTYSWKDDDGAILSTIAIPNLSAGTFAVEVSDANGCIGKSEFTMASYDAPDVSLTTADPTGFCNNAGAVLLTALTDADANYTYQWLRDANPIAGAVSVEYATNQYGLYTVQATNTYGCTSVAGPINVFNYCGGGGGGHGPPGAGAICPPGAIDINYDPNVRCDSFQLHLIDNLGQYVPGSANWVFFISGGAVQGAASGDNPFFVFDNAGKYLMYATVQLQDGSFCKVLDSVKVETVARFDHVADCPGDITQFEDASEFLPSGGITGYAWNFSDPGSGAANTDIIADPQHNFAASGIYQVQLTVTGTTGCTSSATLPVEVPALPDASFATPAARCAGNALLFIPANTPGSLLDVVWDFGDPASGSANDAQGITVYHNYDTPNTYTVTATATNVFGCTASFSMPVTVSPNPLSGTITPANPGALCEGKTLTLSAPAGAVSYLWSDDLMTATQTLVVSEAGVYRVTMTDANGCTFAPPAVNINIAPAPDALIKALLMSQLGQIVGTSYPTLSVCNGEDVFLQAQGNGAYNYVWSGGNGFTDELIFSEDRGNLLSEGVYTYTVTVTNPANGCTSVTDPFIVTVNPNPGGFSISSNSNCAGNSTQLTYTGPEPANWQFFWSTGAPGTQLTTDAFGAFFIRVINEFGCEAKSNIVTVLPGPQVSAIPSGCHERCAPDTLCIPNIPNITSWQWCFNGNPVAGATSSEFIADESGTYYAVLSDAFGCTAQSDPLSIQLTGFTGDLQGTVWSDVNDNGMVGYTSDTTLAGITVMLLQNGVPLDTTVTDANGVFNFNDLPNGWYVVMLDSTTFEPGWRAVIGKDSTYVNGCAEGFDSLELLMRFDCVPMMTTELLTACEGSFALYNGVPVPAGVSQVFQSTDANGCDVFVMVTVLPLPVSSSALSLYACQGSTVAYAGVDLPVGAIQPFPLVNASGCDSIVTVTVLPLATSTGAETLQACPGSTATYEGVDLAIGATMDFTLVNAAGCDSIVTVTVTALPTGASAQEVFVCPGETYLYEGVEVPAGQTQDFTLVNQSGCDSIVTLTVTAYSTPLTPIQVSVCPGTAYEYQGQQIPIGSTGEIQLTGSNGCDSTLMVTVTALPEAVFQLTGTESCPNESNASLQIANLTGGTPPFEYAINASGNWQNDAVFSDLAAGTYTVQVRDAADCVFADTMALTALPEIVFSTAPGVIPCDSVEITLSPALLSGNAADLDFIWSTGDTTRQIKVSDAGTYTFSAQRSNGLCQAVTGAIEVQWDNLGKDEALVYIPNVINPEASDPENGAFRPRFAANLDILKYDFAVFDRWGTQIFRSQNPSDSWMGTFNGSKLRPGVWTWRLEVDIAFCGRVVPIRRSGDVTLVR